AAVSTCRASSPTWAAAAWGAPSSWPSLASSRTRWPRSSEAGSIGLADSAKLLCEFRPRVSTSLPGREHIARSGLDLSSRSERHWVPGGSRVKLDIQLQARTIHTVEKMRAWRDSNPQPYDHKSDSRASS